MTVRFMLGLGVMALASLLFATATARWVHNRKNNAQRRRRRRRGGKAIRIDDFMVKPNEAEPSEP
jgi:hypothetical protein